MAAAIAVQPIEGAALEKLRPQLSDALADSSASVAAAWKIGSRIFASVIRGDESNGTNTVYFFETKDRHLIARAICNGPYSGLSGVIGPTPKSSRNDLFLDVRDAGHRYRLHYRARRTSFLFVEEIPLDGAPDRSRFAPQGSR